MVTTVYDELKAAYLAGRAIFGPVIFLPHVGRHAVDTYSGSPIVMTHETPSERVHGRRSRSDAHGS